MTPVSLKQSRKQADRFIRLHRQKRAALSRSAVRKPSLRFIPPCFAALPH
jgi:hypothetical protein